MTSRTLRLLPSLFALLRALPAKHKEASHG